MSTNERTTTVIEHRVSEIKRKANQAEEIKERIEREEQQRQRAERKNRAFNKLASEIEKIEGERERLANWIELARTLEVELDKGDIQGTVEELERELQEFADTSYSDFDDAADVSDLRDKTFDPLRTAVQRHADNVQSKVEQECGSREEQIRLTRTALRIPDLGEPGDMDQLDEIVQFLTTIQNGELPSDAAQRWRRLEERYDDIEISLDGVQSRFDLSDATISVIRRFLDDETVMLSELDSDVLNELQTFEEFSGRLAIQFKEET
jgi:hypothetical protein